MSAVDVHARGAAGDLPSLPQALEFSFSVCLRLALHVVITKGSAAVTDEVRSAHQWRGTSSDLIDLGNVIGEGSGVDETTLVEPGDPGQLVSISDVKQRRESLVNLPSFP